MSHPRHWSLGVKLALVGAPFLLLALLIIAITLWVSWQLEGGAAAVNEAGRMRMQAYRLSLSIGTADDEALPAQLAEFERSLAAAARRRSRASAVRAVGRRRAAGLRGRRARLVAVSRAVDSARSPSRWSALRADTAAFTAHIDALVAAIETHMSRWTALLHLLQIAMMTLAVLGTAVLLYTGYLFVLEPVGQLKEATERIQRGDFGARVQRITSDEFGTLAKGFNGMAEHLQSMYRNLEARVAEKTSELQEKRERLEALYDVTTLAAKATTLDGARHRIHAARRPSRARRRRRAALVRRDQPALPAARLRGLARRDDRRRAVHQGRRLLLRLAIGVARRTRHSDPVAGSPPACTIAATPDSRRSCRFRSLQHDRLMGEVDLFFHNQFSLSAAERSLLEALTAHLAGAMENLRLNALEKEAAVSQERTFLARELHDSIAQSLAFLKIQVHLMRDALAAGDARAGASERWARSTPACANATATCASCSCISAPAPTPRTSSRRC